MKIAFQAEGVTLYNGDCIEVMRTLPDESVHAVVTDPPYALEFMGRDWDGWATPKAFEEWCEEWASEALRVLKPGGHLLAFGGSRTWHRLAAGIEDAGFEMRDSIAWLYGSGFPKSMDVSKAIDSLDAAEERANRAREFQTWLAAHMTARAVNEATGTDMGHHLTTHPTQPAVATAELFDMLRPHLPTVPIRIEELVAERTVESRNLASRRITGKRAAGTTRGVSGFTVSGEGKERRDIAHTEAAAEWQGWGTALKPAFEPIVVARKPLAGTVAANVLAHGVGALNIDATRTPAADSQLAMKYASVQGAGPRVNSVYGADDRGRDGAAPHPGGRWPTNVLLDESQVDALDAQTGVSRSRIGKPRGAASGEGWGMTATGAEYDDEGGASRFFPTFRYEAKAPTSERPNVDGVQHPTVKPLDLMRWLCRLVTPTGGVVLEPFAGSGTTLEAALLEGFEVVGIEREADYLPLIVQRITKPLQVSLFGDWGDAA